MTLTKQQQIIQNIHSIEMQLINMLEISNEAIQQAGEENDLENKEAFEESCMKLSEMYSSIQSNFNKVLSQVDPSILEQTYTSFPYKLSTASDEKRLELQAKALYILEKAIKY
jgi:hypothetical protein